MLGFINPAQHSPQMQKHAQGHWTTLSLLDGPGEFTAALPGMEVTRSEIPAEGLSFSARVVASRPRWTPPALWNHVQYKPAAFVNDGRAGAWGAHFSAARGAGAHHEGGLETDEVPDGRTSCLWPSTW